jgi:hypothetical protein
MPLAASVETDEDSDGTAEEDGVMEGAFDRPGKCSTPEKWSFFYPIKRDFAV